MPKRLHTSTNPEIRQVVDSYLETAKKQHRLQSTNKGSILEFLKKNDTAKYTEMLDKLKSKGYEFHETATQISIKRARPTSPDPQPQQQEAPAQPPVQVQVQQTENKETTTEKPIERSDTENMAQRVLRTAWESGNWRRQAVYDVAGQLNTTVMQTIAYVMIDGVRSVAPEVFSQRLNEMQIFLGVVLTAKILKYVTEQYTNVPIVEGISNVIRQRITQTQPIDAPPTESIGTGTEQPQTAEAGTATRTVLSTGPLPSRNPTPAVTRHQTPAGTRQQTPQSQDQRTAAMAHIRELANLVEDFI